jgi:hypothetical protein
MLPQVPAMVAGSFGVMEHQSTIFGALGGISVTYLIILLPMYAISAKESEYASAPAEPASRD